MLRPEHPDSEVPETSAVAENNDANLVFHFKFSSGHGKNITRGKINFNSWFSLSQNIQISSF